MRRAIPLSQKTLSLAAAATDDTFYRRLDSMDGKQMLPTNLVISPASISPKLIEEIVHAPIKNALKPSATERTCASVTLDTTWG